MFRPFRAALRWGERVPQGVALGFRTLPLRGDAMFGASLRVKFARAERATGD